MEMKEKMDDKEVVFGHLLNGIRKSVIDSICHKYPMLSWEDSEDIFQEGSLELRKKWKEINVEWKKSEFGKLLYGICRNIGGHYIRKTRSMDILDEGRFVIVEERDEEKESRLMLVNDLLEREGIGSNVLLREYELERYSREDGIQK